MLKSVHPYFQMVFVETPHFSFFGDGRDGVAWEEDSQFLLKPFEVLEPPVDVPVALWGFNEICNVFMNKKGRLFLHHIWLYSDANFFVFLMIQFVNLWCGLFLHESIVILICWIVRMAHVLYFPSLMVFLQCLLLLFIVCSNCLFLFTGLNIFLVLLFIFF